MYISYEEDCCYMICPENILRTFNITHLIFNSTIVNIYVNIFKLLNFLGLWTDKTSHQALGFTEREVLFKWILFYRFGAVLKHCVIVITLKDYTTMCN